MGTIYTTCPVSGREISTDVATDADSFARMPEFVARVLCPYCKVDHNWTKHNSFIVEDGAGNAGAAGKP
jgi:hypothetical protein